jgi:hypothetical protein
MDGEGDPGVNEENVHMIVVVYHPLLVAGLSRAGEFVSKPLQAWIFSRCHRVG